MQALKPVLSCYVSPSNSFQGVVCSVISDFHLGDNFSNIQKLSALQQSMAGAGIWEGASMQERTSTCDYKWVSRVRAHWPTKENRNVLFLGPWRTWSGMAPNGAGNLFPADLDLADILGNMDFDFDNICFFGFQMSRFQHYGFPSL